MFGASVGYVSIQDIDYCSKQEHSKQISVDPGSSQLLGQLAGWDIIPQAYGLAS